MSIEDGLSQGIDPPCPSCGHQTSVQTFVPAAVQCRNPKCGDILPVGDSSYASGWKDGFKAGEASVQRRQEETVMRGIAPAKPAFFKRCGESDGFDPTMVRI